MKRISSKMVTTLQVLCACMAALLFSGCVTERKTERMEERYYAARLVERMDSLVHRQQVTQQEFVERQSSLVDKFKQTEVRDTSHTIFLGTAGDTIREKIVIYVDRNTEHSTAQEEKESLRQYFLQIDSIINSAVRKNEEHYQALLSDKQTTVVKETIPWYRRLLNAAGWMITGAIIAIALWTTRKWWLALFLKQFKNG